MNITAEQLKQYLHYNPDDGSFTWIKRPAYRIKVGSKAQSKDANGYISICLLGKTNQAHRLAWLYMTGEWPSNLIDHINRNPSDNRWCNLREATRAQNNYNIKKSVRNTSGYKGVSFHKNTNKWKATINVKCKPIHLGLFDNKEQAAEAYIQAAKKYHGEFASF